MDEDRLYHLTLILRAVIDLLTAAEAEAKGELAMTEAEWQSKLNRITYAIYQAE